MDINSYIKSKSEILPKGEIAQNQIKQAMTVNFLSSHLNICDTFFVER